MTTVAIAPDVVPATPSPRGLLDRADTLERWSATAPPPLATAYRRRAGALRLLAFIKAEQLDAAS